MRSFLLAGLVLVTFCIAVGAIGDECKADQDCGHSKCCTRKKFAVLFVKNVCVDRPKRGQVCTKGTEEELKDKTACPCVDDLECRAGEIKDIGAGIIIEKDVICRERTTEGYKETTASQKVTPEEKATTAEPEEITEADKETTTEEVIVEESEETKASNEE